MGFCESAILGREFRQGTGSAEVRRRPNRTYLVNWWRPQDVCITLRTSYFSYRTNSIFFIVTCGEGFMLGVYLYHCIKCFTLGVVTL